MFKKIVNKVNLVVLLLILSVVTAYADECLCAGAR